MLRTKRWEPQQHTTTLSGLHTGETHLYLRQEFTPGLLLLLLTPLQTPWLPIGPLHSSFVMQGRVLLSFLPGGCHPNVLPVVRTASAVQKIYWTYKRRQAQPDHGLAALFTGSFLPLILICICRMPFYYEIKLLFVLWLILPQTKVWQAYQWPELPLQMA